MDDIAAAIAGTGLDGLIVSNTTISRDAVAGMENADETRRPLAASRCSTSRPAGSRRCASASARCRSSGSAASTRRRPRSQSSKPAPTPSSSIPRWSSAASTCSTASSAASPPRCAPSGKRDDRELSRARKTARLGRRGRDSQASARTAPPSAARAPTSRYTARATKQRWSAIQSPVLPQHRLQHQRRAEEQHQRRSMPLRIMVFSVTPIRMPS